MADSKDLEVVDDDQIGIAELIALIPDKRQQKALSAYYRNRDVAMFESWKHFSGEAGFLYDLAAAAPMSQFLHARIKLLQGLLKDYSMMFKTWMETEMLKHLEAKVEMLQGDLDSLLHHVKHDLDKVSSERVLNRWKLERTGPKKTH